MTRPPSSTIVWLDGTGFSVGLSDVFSNQIQAAEQPEADRQVALSLMEESELEWHPLSPAVKRLMSLESEYSADVSTPIRPQQ